MKPLLMALLMAVSPAVVAYSGTFVEDFNDENLDGWHLLMAPAPPFFPIVDLLKFENGYLVIDPVFRGQRHSVSMELRTGNVEEWDSYTLTCRIRFEFKEDLELGASFHLDVRYSEGPEVQRGNETFTQDNFQELWILLAPKQEIHVFSNHPNKAFPVGNAVLSIHRAKFSLNRLEQPIADRWIPIKIVAKGKFFEFYFDNQLVARYEHGKARPGTVRFAKHGGSPVHLDDITITGQRVPFNGGPHSVAPEAHLVTTWGEIKNSHRR